MSYVSIARLHIIKSKMADNDAAARADVKPAAQVMALKVLTQVSDAAEPRLSVRCELDFDEESSLTVPPSALHLPCRKTKK